MLSCVLVAMDARHLVSLVREAAAQHGAVWRVLVPDAETVNPAAEADEEAAYAAMESAKAALRAHIRSTYGVSIEELTRLAQG